jgi:tetratricopeptide (TPR) repeat protein
MTEVSGTGLAAHPTSAQLFAAWHTADASERRKELTGLSAPVPIALRSRYRHLLDEQAPAGPWNPDWSRAQWDAVLTLESEGDLAISHNDVTKARTAFTALLQLDFPDSTGLTAVHAHIGLGDIGLATDESQRAASGYETAFTLARAAGYRFGQLRALVGLGYVTLMYHTGATALERFGEAVELAKALDDPVYEGNAALGASECLDRLGDLDQAVGYATEAYECFATFGTAMGGGNAAQRLGAMWHRLGDLGKAREWLELAQAAFTEAHNPMGITNVLSCLGDLQLDQDAFDGAEQSYRAALVIAEATPLPRSRAHALQDLGRLARCRHDWEKATGYFTQSLAAYSAIDDMLGMSFAYDKLARTYGDLADVHQLLQTRMDAIYAVEEFRATHTDDRSQEEYRNRFAGVYASALNAATEHSSAESFAVVADCLAGRRLAGLFAETGRASGSTGELTLLQDLVVRADQRLIEHRRGPSDLPTEAGTRRENIIRMLGAIGIRHGLAPRAEASLDDLLATVYLPLADEGSALLAALPDHCQTLQLLLDPADDRLLRWLWRLPDGTVQLGATELAAAATALIAALSTDGEERASLRIDDLEPLGDLLPASLRATIATGAGHRLVLVPVGELWFIPWGAVPIDSQRVLGETTSYVLCPSLTVQRQIAERPAAHPDAPGRPRSADLWRSPLIDNHQLAEFAADPAWRVRVLRSAAEAKQLLRAGSDTMVIAGHGRPLAGPGHYLELDHGQWLLPVDLIGARPPDRLAMIACWGGAIPGRHSADPLSLATLALAAGSSEILATVGELADSIPASAYVERVLAAMARDPIPEALRVATAYLLTDEVIRSEPIHHWAPLVPIGSYDSA